MSKRVLVFGVFDGMHTGHEAFLRQAGENGKVTVVVARDDSVLDIKGFRPRQSEAIRLDALKASKYVSHARLGDKEQSTYHVIKELKPDVICFGYDQTELQADVKNWLAKNCMINIEIVRLKAHQPDRYKSSLLS